MNHFPYPPRRWIFLAMILWFAIMFVDWTISVPHNTTWNWTLTFIWSIGLPAVAFAAGAGTRYLFWQQRVSLSATALGPRPGQLIYQIPTIGRWDVWGGLCRVMDSCLAAQRLSQVPVTIWVVTEEGAPILPALRDLYVPRGIEVIVVPRSYIPARGSRFKARANQYANECRAHRGWNHPEVWTFHLDDDTSIPLTTHEALESFITRARQPYTLAQGLLTFPRDHSSHRISWLADAIRPADDITRFFLFTGLLHRPWVGLHGENLLIRADREDAVGWDYGPTVIAEDAYFGLAFAQQFPREATFLPAITTGSSPASLDALWAQRSRWVEGLWRLILDPSVSWRTKGILASYVGYWMTALLQNAIPLLALAYGFGWDNTSPVARWVAVGWGAIYGFWVAAYWIGYRINVMVSEARPTIRHQMVDMAALVVALPLLSLLEIWGTLRGLRRLRHKVVQFTVIAKSL